MKKAFPSFQVMQPQGHIYATLGLSPFQNRVFCSAILGGLLVISVEVIAVSAHLVLEFLESLGPLG
jgi:hypothetical protein